MSNITIISMCMTLFVVFGAICGIIMLILDVKMWEWIYTYDVLPSKSGVYLVTWTGKGDGVEERNFIELIEYTDEGEWDLSKLERKGYTDYRIIAWMDAPNPCKDYWKEMEGKDEQ